MALDQSALLDVLDALQVSESEDVVRSALQVRPSQPRLSACIQRSSPGLLPSSETCLRDESTTSTSSRQRELPRIPNG